MSENSIPFSDSEFADFSLRIVLYLECKMDEEQFVSFEQELRTADWKRETFVTTCQTWAALHEQAQAIANLSIDRDTPFRIPQAISEVESNKHLDDAAIMPAIKEKAAPAADAIVMQMPAVPKLDPVESSNRNQIRVLTSQRRFPRWRTAAAILIALSVGALAYLHFSAAKPVATLASEIGATWEKSSQPIIPGKALPLTQLKLKSGLARIQFSNDASIIVEAPATFTVHSNMEVSLDSGRLSALIPPPAHGFVVKLPFGEVKDNGTEFGASAGELGWNDVAVFQGDVIFTAAAAKQQNQFGRRLFKGDASRINSKGDMTPIDSPEADSFVRHDLYNKWSEAGKSSPATSTQLVLQRVTYDSLRHDPSLAVLYKFDNNDQVKGIVQNRAMATGRQFDIPLDAHSPAIENDAAKFDLNQHQWLALPRGPVTTNAQLSVSAWVYAETRARWGTIAKSWSDMNVGQMHFGLHDLDGDLEIMLGGQTSVAREGAGHPFPLHQWVHVAFVTDGKTVTVYRDGAPVASSEAMPLSASPVVKSLWIGAKMSENRVEASAGKPGFWDGSISSMAIFYRALSPAEIADMYKLGRL